jgi:hypothetical protein
MSIANSLDNMNDDLQRWLNDPLPTPPSQTRWLFAGGECRQSASVRFMVIDITGHEICAIRVHRNLAMILAYLDLQYWKSERSAQESSSWNNNRIKHYLGRVREDVVTELLGEDSTALICSSFGTTAMREWAVMVHHVCGHSRSGRNQYEDLCTSNG